MPRRRRRKPEPVRRTWSQWWFLWIRDVISAALWSVGITDPGRVDQETGDIWRTVKGEQPRMAETDANGQALVRGTVDRASSILTLRAPKQAA